MENLEVGIQFSVPKKSLLDIVSSLNDNVIQQLIFEPNFIEKYNIFSCKATV